MSVASEEHHRPQSSAGHVLMALTAGALAVAAAYLWLTDDSAPISLPSMAPSHAVAAMPVDSAPVTAKAPRAIASAVQAETAPESAPTASAPPRSTPQPEPADAQIAADAAAVGMTSRIRPATSNFAGQ